MDGKGQVEEFNRLEPEPGKAYPSPCAAGLDAYPGDEGENEKEERKKPDDTTVFFPERQGNHVHHQHACDTDKEPFHLLHPEGEGGTVLFQGRMGCQGKDHQYPENGQDQGDDPEKGIHLRAPCR
jgi:hypothetical protein